MHGWRAYEPKQRRAVRRRNHIAFDLGSDKYRQRIKPPKRREDYLTDDWQEDIMDMEEDYDSE